MDDATVLTWIDRVQVVSTLLVAIGVAGEFLGSWIASPIRKRVDQGKEAEVARFHKQAEEASERAAQLQLELERERAARLPRSISNENRAKMIVCLRNGPRGPITVVPKTFDEEAEAYAQQITDIFQLAQFEVRPLQGPRPMGFGRSGLFMFVNNLQKWPDHAAHVQRCFSEAGVQLNSVFPAPNEVPDPTVVLIAVSSKP